MQYLNEILLASIFIILCNIYFILRKIYHKLDSCTNFYLDKLWRYSDQCKHFTEVTIDSRKLYDRAYDPSVTHDDIWAEDMAFKIAVDILKEDSVYRSQYSETLIEEANNFLVTRDRIKRAIQLNQRSIRRHRDTY